MINKEILKHWWKYTKLRYYYRWLLHVIFERQRVYFWRNGVIVERGWLIGYDYYTSDPGPCMTRDEHEHWFVK